MGLIGWLKGVFNRMFNSDIKAQFGVDPIVSSAMSTATQNWMSIYGGSPDWLDQDDNIRTINFAKTICSETARLTTLAISIKLSGSSRAEYLQAQVDRALYPKLRRWVEYGCAAGTVIFKPNGDGIDVVTPDRFMVTECNSNKYITGIIFQDTYHTGRDYYTKLEYHRYWHAVINNQDTTFYKITTKAYHSDTATTLGHEVDLRDTKWDKLLPEVNIAKKNGDPIDHMLFGVFTMPEANNIDLDSPLGMSIFSGAIEELKDLDVAYSRNGSEIYDSNSIELIDESLIMETGKKANSAAPKTFRLPSHVKKIAGNVEGDYYQAIDRPLKTDMRKIGINQQLSFVGYKCGYSNGYFTFDEKTGSVVTATQVESADRRTIQLIKDIRDQLQGALEDTIYAINVFADLYQLAPVGFYTTEYNFGDITYNEDEDRQRNYQLMLQGLIPKWYYLMKWEGLSEDEAKAMVESANQAEADKQSLFSKASEE